MIDAEMGRGVLVLCILVCVSVLTGCQGDGQKRRTQPQGDLKAVQVQLNVGLPFDSDGNGYADTVQAMVYMFPDSRVTNIPVGVKGTFEFVMHNGIDRMMGRWIFPPDIVARAERNMAAGPGYSFYLRLSPGTDKMSPMSVDIRARFTSLDGQEIRSTGRTSVRLGG